MNAIFEDANPREVFIAVCFLSLILAIGFYPKLATQMYDATTVAVNAEIRASYQQIAEANPQIYAWNAGQSALAEAQSAPVLGLVK